MSEAGIGSPQPLDGDPGRVAGQRRKGSLLRVSSYARQLQEFLGDIRLQDRRFQLRPALSCCRRPALPQLAEPLVDVGAV